MPVIVEGVGSGMRLVGCRVVPPEEILANVERWEADPGEAPPWYWERVEFVRQYALKMLKKRKKGESSCGNPQ